VPLEKLRLHRLRFLKSRKHQALFDTRFRDFQTVTTVSLLIRPPHTEGGFLRTRSLFTELTERRRFLSLELLGDAPAAEAVFYCGSGVSACVNLLAMVRAGLPEGRLYLGSWSEWSRVGGPVARGR